jgi:hypothetical protein
MADNYAPVSDPNTLKALTGGGQPATSGYAPVNDANILSQLQGTAAKPPPSQEPETDTSQMGAGELAKTAAKNIPASAGHFAKSMVQPFIHPIQTATSVKDLGAGVLEYLGVMGGDQHKKYADAVGNFMVQRYGGWEALKHTLATDPVGLMADAATVLTMGGAGLERLPGVLGDIGEVVSAAGRYTDPLTAVGKVGQVGGKVIGHQVGTTTGTGSRPIGEAFKAGKEGGEAGEVFRQNLRQPKEILPEVVQEARGAVTALKAERGKAYRSGMVDVSKDKEILDFHDIDAAIARTEDIGKFKGFDIQTRQERATRQRMIDKINEFRQLGYGLGTPMGAALAYEYHTVEGFDALKKALGKIANETERGSPASKVAWDIYGSVKDTIVKQAPAYAKVMEGYEEASNIIKEIERELVGKPDANVTTALRKLQTVMRNNVHTAYGSREAMAELLKQNGAEHLMTALAGQALATWRPRGLSGSLVTTAGLAEGIGFALLHDPKILAATLLTLPFMTPRLMGEAAHMAGRVAPWAPGRRVGEAAFQVGRVPEEEQTKLGPTTRFDASGKPLQ